MKRLRISELDGSRNAPELFDSNILIDSLNGVPEANDEIGRSVDRAVSVVTWIEVLAGVPEADLAGARSFLSTFKQIDLSAEVLERALLLRRSTRLKLPDAVILASAQVTGRQLVTRNTRDFSEAMAGVRVPYRR